VLYRGGENARSDRLGEKQPIADDGARIREEVTRIGTSSDRQTVLELLVDDCMAASNHGARLMHFVLPTTQNLSQHPQGELSGWKADNIEGSEWLTTHCVDIGERVGGGDLSERIRIVDDRGEEVDCLHEGETFGQHENPRIVEAFATDDEAGIGAQRERGERLREVARTQLGGSTGAARELRQSEKFVARWVRAGHGFKSANR